MSGKPQATDPANTPENRLRAELFELLDEARRHAKISAYELCRAAKVHQTTYSRIRKAPHTWSRTTMRRLTRALGRLQGLREQERDRLTRRISQVGRRPKKSTEERNAA